MDISILRGVYDTLSTLRDKTFKEADEGLDPMDRPPIVLSLEQDLKVSKCVFTLLKGASEFAYPDRNYFLKP